MHEIVTGIVSASSATKVDHHRMDQLLDLLFEHAHELAVNDLAELYTVFDDNVADQDRLWTLLHILENADLTLSAEAVVEAAPTMRKKGAQDWLEVIAIRFINAKGSCKAFSDAITRSDSPHQDAIFLTLEAVSRGDDLLADRVNEILQKRRARSR